MGKSKEVAREFVEVTVDSEESYNLEDFSGFTPDQFVEWATEIKDNYAGQDIVFRTARSFAGGQVLLLKERRLETDSEYSARLARLKRRVLEDEKKEYKEYLRLHKKYKNVDKSSV